MGQVWSMITHEETGLINRIVNEVYGLYCSVRNKSEQLTREDLLHYGIQGLLEARSRFDRSKNVPWLVYATYRVRGVMLDHIRKLPLVRLPYGRYKKLKELVDTKLELLKLHGQVSSDMLAEKLGWSVDEVNETFSFAQTLVPLSLSKLDYEGETVDCLKIQLAAEELGPEDTYVRRELSELLTNCMKGLAHGDRLILLSRVLKGAKLRELAESMLCSTENIRLRQKKAEKQMKRCIKDNGWSIEKCFEEFQ